MTTKKILLLVLLLTLAMTSSVMDGQQWGCRNPKDGDTWFVSFITHRSVFPERL